MHDYLNNHLALRPKDRVNAGPDPIPVFYHYTSFQGLSGIVKDRELWATNIHYLNDYSEFRNAVQDVDTIIRNRLPDAGPAHAAIYRKILDHLERSSEISIYVSSFSEDEDLLSQWRGYAGGSGVSIGFSFADIRELAERSDFLVIKCIYDAETKHNILIQILNQITQIWAPRLSSDPDLDEQAAINFRNIFLRYAPAFKNGSFREEAEWRLVSPPVACNHESIAFRHTSTMLVPYYRFKLDALGKKGLRGSDDLCIRTITVGPNNNRDLAKSSISMLLCRYNIHWSNLSACTTPYRGSL